MDGLVSTSNEKLKWSTVALVIELLRLTVRLKSSYVAELLDGGCRSEVVSSTPK